MFLRFFDSITISTFVSDHFDIREQAQFTRSLTQSVPTYFFYVAQTSSITIRLIYHRSNRLTHNYHTQSFVLCNIEQESRQTGTKEIILQSRRGGFLHWSGSLKPKIYVLIPFSASFWQEETYEKEPLTRDFTLVIRSSIQLNGTLTDEPPTLLADCLIAATMKYREELSKDQYSSLFVTSSSLATKFLAAENKSTTHYLHVNIDIIEANHIRHSFYTNDFLLPQPRQLICIVECTNRQGEAGHN